MVRFLLFKLRYTAIRVRDLDKAIAFYTDVLGMRLTSRTKVAETKGEFAIVRSADSDHYLEINWYDGQEYNSGDELDHIAFEVDDLTAALSELAKKGVTPRILRSGICVLALDLDHRPERNLDRTLSEEDVNGHHVSPTIAISIRICLDTSDFLS